MHNRKKPDRARTAEEIAAVQKKTRTYASLVSILLERRRKRGNSAETLALIEKMLNNNPDFYTLYNFRREVLYDTYPQLTVCEEGSKYSAEDANDICEVELALSAKGIECNPKSCKHTRAKSPVVGFYCSLTCNRLCMASSPLGDQQVQFGFRERVGTVQ
jgi:geranylgeranyl transferase type-2 subunit alpha